MFPLPDEPSDQELATEDQFTCFATAVGFAVFAYAVIYCLAIYGLRLLGLRS